VVAANDTISIHGTAIARHGSAALLRGPSGVGKSDLALRALTTPIQLPGERSSSLFELICDDQTVLTEDEGIIFASAPASIRGQLEVRGIDIVQVPWVARAPLLLVADLTQAPIERLPERQNELATWLGHEISTVAINPFEASAPIKLALTLARAKGRQSSTNQSRAKLP